MKRRILLSAILFAGFLASGAQAATVIVSSPSPVFAGSLFDVSVLVQDAFTGRPGDAITGFGFNVTIGSAIVTYTGATVNGLYFFDAGPVAGTDVVGLSNSPFGISAGDFVEPLLLATLHFTANAQGTTSVGVTSDNRDPNQGLYFLLDSEDFTNSQQVQVQTQAVPEPATFAAVGLALAGVCLTRRARQSRRRRLF